MNTWMYLMECFKPLTFMCLLYMYIVIFIPLQNYNLCGMGMSIEWLNLFSNMYTCASHLYNTYCKEWRNKLHYTWYILNMQPWLVCPQWWMLSVFSSIHVHLRVPLLKCQKCHAYTIITSCLQLYPGRNSMTRGSGLWYMYMYMYIWPFNLTSNGLPSLILSFSKHCIFYSDFCQLLFWWHKNGVWQQRNHCAGLLNFLCMVLKCVIFIGDVHQWNGMGQCPVKSPLWGYNYHFKNCITRKCVPCKHTRTCVVFRFKFCTLVPTLFVSFVKRFTVMGTKKPSRLELHIHVSPDMCVNNILSSIRVHVHRGVMSVLIAFCCLSLQSFSSFTTL